jgi:hypothetical protein
MPTAEGGDALSQLHNEKKANATVNQNPPMAKGSMGGLCWKGAMVQSAKIAPPREQGKKMVSGPLYHVDLNV